AIFAQQSSYHIHEDRYYRKAMELFKKENYGAAREFFQKAYDHYGSRSTVLKSKAQYYSALCAVKLFNEDAEYLTSSFIKENPESPLLDKALFNLAGYFYELEKYNKALLYYDRINKNKLSDKESAECYFKTGYSHFKKDDPDNARLAFNEIKDKNTRYTPPAIYYYSHINYSQGNYQTALDGFLRLSEDGTFSPIVPYYVTQIYFLQEKYEKVVEYAPGLLDNVTKSKHAEVSRITGVSFYMLNRYKESTQYLQYYVDSAGNVTNEDKYQLAYAYYKSGDYDKAANIFGKLTNENSLLSHNSLYHLADCYIKLDKKHEARMAFASASRMDNDPEIKEDALFNYALVTYELSYSPFNEAIQAFNDYIKLYPNSKRTDEAYKYLMQAYLNAKNYSLALSSIDKITKKSDDIKKAYQKIAYYRALELFNNLKFTESIELLNSSVKYGSLISKLYALAFYWKGEAYYRLKDYDRAIAEYKKFTGMPISYYEEEFNLAHYNLGYAYFKKENYSDAALWFRKFTGFMKGNNTKRIGDAFNRIGDCYFIQTDYYSAIDFYDRSIEAGKTDVDYALFQKGLALGVVNKFDEKIQNLNKLLASWPNSAFTDDALYEIGESYLSQQQPEKAISNFQKIVSTFPNSSYVSKALVKLGLVYYNTNRPQESLKLYKKVVSNYPGSEDARSALKGIKNIYVDMNNIDAYFDYVNNLGDFAKVDLREQDSLSYITAEKLYMAGDCENSSKGFKRYIEKFKEGSFILDANFYKGDCNYRLKQYDEAMKSFDYVIGKPKNIYTEQALLGASRIRFKLKDYTGAINYYKKLEEVTEIKSNLLEARIGLMRCYYFLDDFTEAVDAAKKVINTEKISAAVERESRFILAKSLYENDRMMLALEEFKKVAVEVNSNEGAESKFRIAEIYYKRGEMESAEKEIFDFTEKTTPHQYWMAKSFILWSDIFASRDDYFQAIQTLQSIIDYYDNSTDGIISLAKEKKEKLVKEEQSAGQNAEQRDMEVNMQE
ncbi:MAG: tetratricopeptide repeat protein, partial [Bacteroidales bacterium]